MPMTHGEAAAPLLSFSMALIRSGSWESQMMLTAKVPIT